MPAHRRGPWSQAEDHALMMLVARTGASNWVRISQMIQTRSPKQCRERYHQNLKPNLNHTPITTDEGRQIEDLVATIGKRWAEIARRLPGRSDNAVKNWWNGGQNKKRRASGRDCDSSSSDSTQMFDPANPGYPRERFILPPPLSLPLQPSTSAFDRALPSPVYSIATGYGPSKGRPEPLELGMQHQHPGLRHYSYPTPLPSPSGYPTSADSSMSAPGDGSISISPLTPIGLPPLIGGRDERRHSEVAWLPPNTAGFVGNDGQFEPFPRHVFNNGPMFKEPQWQPRRESPVDRFPRPLSDFGMMAQQPLPTYDSLQMSMPAPMNSILPTNSLSLSPSSASRSGICSMLNQNNGYGTLSKSHASPGAPESPNSLSLQTSSPPRSSKMDISSLV